LKRLDGTFLVTAHHHCRLFLLNPKGLTFLDPTYQQHFLTATRYLGSPL